MEFFGKPLTQYEDEMLDKLYKVDMLDITMYISN